MAIVVATHEATAARSSQPADGAVELPPTLFGMSVTVSSPFGPRTRHVRPLSMTAVATESVYRASSGFPLRYATAFWSAVLIASAHFAPHWSAFSDSYLDLSLDPFSWLAAGVEVAAALALGFVGLQHLRADQTLREPGGSASVG